MAVPAEERIRPLDGAFPQLVDPSGTMELRERDAAEERGAERFRRHSQVRGGVGLARHAALELPAAGVPRAEVVGNLEDDRTVVRVRPPRESRADVDETHPDPVT